MKKRIFCLIVFCMIYFPLYSESSDKPGTPAWDYNAAAAIVSTPAISEGQIYFGDTSDQFYCLDVAKGTALWTYKTEIAGNNIISSPCVANGKVYFGSYKDRKIHCLDTKTGKQVWEYSCGGEVESSPHFDDGKIYFGSWDQKVYCLEAESGKKLWEFETRGNIRSSPLVLNGKVYMEAMIKIFTA